MITFPPQDFFDLYALGLVTFAGFCFVWVFGYCSYIVWLIIKDLFRGPSRRS